MAISTGSNARRLIKPNEDVSFFPVSVQRRGELRPIRASGSRRIDAHPFRGILLANLLDLGAIHTRTPGSTTLTVSASELLLSNTVKDSP